MEEVAVQIDEPIKDVKKRNKSLQKEKAVHELEIERINNEHNNYTTSKSVSQNLINTSLIISLINTVVVVIKAGDLNGYKITLMVCIAASISIQIIMFALLVILAKATQEKIGRTCSATKINVWVTILSGILPIISGTIAILDQTSR